MQTSCLKIRTSCIKMQTSCLKIRTSCLKIANKLLKKIGTNLQNKNLTDIVTYCQCAYAYE